MADNLTVNKVIYDGDTLIDLTEDTATVSDVAQGKTFHLASGVQATGTAVSQTVNDGVLTIQRNGSNVQTFSANQSTDVTANIKVPSVFVGYCNTNADLRTVQLYDDTGFSYANGTTLIVYFHRASYTGGGNIDLQIGYDQETYPVMFNGRQLSSSNPYNGWEATSTVVFTFRSDGWNMLGNVNTVSSSPSDGVLTIQRNGTAVTTFSANQSSNTTANIVVPTDADDISYSDTTHQTQLGDNVGDAIEALDYELSGVLSGLAGKQDTLVSGTNIKTVNNESLLGSGNITISGGSSYTAGSGINIANNEISVDSNMYYNKTLINGLLSTKQNELTAGHNITISNNVISSSGATVYYGTTEPSASIGSDGDLYVMYSEE